MPDGEASNAGALRCPLCDDEMALRPSVYRCGRCGTEIRLNYGTGAWNNVTRRV